jgi:acyl carrier protein
MTGVPGVPGEPEIGGWLADYVGELLAVPGAEIDRDATFDSFGVDSATAIIITGELQDWLQIPVSPDVAEDYPTIRSLGRHLATLVAAKNGRNRRGR